MKFPDAKTPGPQCTKMEEVREEIDRLDRILVQLIAERQSYMDAAARIKPEKDMVRVPWRIEDVVAKVLAQAEIHGLSKRIAEPVWREMIERCIEYEHEMWSHLRETDEKKAV